MPEQSRTKNDKPKTGTRQRTSRFSDLIVVILIGIERLSKYVCLRVSDQASRRRQLSIEGRHLRGPVLARVYSTLRVVELGRSNRARFSIGVITTVNLPASVRSQDLTCASLVRYSEHD